MTDIKLSARHLNMSFGEKQILRDINIEIPSNEVVSLIGPSGCGKSTLLRCFNRMHDLSPDAKVTGELLFEQQDINARNASLTTLRKRIGMVFQKPNPLPKSIFENMAYGLKIHNYPKKEIPAMVEAALKESHLWEEVKDELHKPAVKLSGGQQQRLCIARTIVLRPEVILMDEPCSALDPISTSKVEELILRLKQEYTIVIVTHNMQQAKRISDKVAFMYLGELIEFDTSDIIFNHAKVESTRKYVGGYFG